MRRIGSSPFAFPSFSGATRQLVLINLCTYFGLALLGLTSSGNLLTGLLAFSPNDFLRGLLWQPFTYSFVHPTPMIVGTLFELLSLWFLAGFLENFHGGNWIWSLYGVSALGTAAASLVIYLLSGAMHSESAPFPLYGCFGGIFGMLVAIGVLYGDTEFLLMFVIAIKARYMAIIYGIVAIAMLFGPQRQYAFAQLGGAVAGFLYVRSASRKGFSFAMSEGWYGMRNRFYRWKRRRAARKFEVYMKQHGRTVRFDGQGRVLHDDPDDKSRWN